MSNVNEKIASYLGENMERNAIASLVYRKKGMVRGASTEKKTYGDDLVSVVIITGFSYKDVVRKSMDMLINIKADDIVQEAAQKGLVDKEGKPLTYSDAQRALLETWGSFERSLSEEDRGKPSSPFKPLEVDGEYVPGCRVYEGETAVPGTIYLSGLKVGEKVIEHSPNGPCPQPKSKAVSIAKRLVRNRLPVGRYVSYSLEPGTNFDLRIGNSAGYSIEGDEVIVRDEELQQIQAFL
jgi:hypothetical protein